MLFSTLFVFVFVIVIGFIAGAAFVLAVFVVPYVVTSATPLAVSAILALVIVVTTGAV